MPSSTWSITMTPESLRSRRIAAQGPERRLSAERHEELLYGMVQISAELRPMFATYEILSRARA